MKFRKVAMLEISELKLKPTGPKYTFQKICHHIISSRFTMIKSDMIFPNISHITYSSTRFGTIKRYKIIVYILYIIYTYLYMYTHLYIHMSA